MPFESVQHNVFAFGPLVIKRIRGPNSQRRFYSELLTRAALKRVNVPIVKSLFAIAPLRLFAMPYYYSHSISQARMSTLQRLAAHGMELSTLLCHTSPAGGYGWLDRKRRMRLFPTFGQFLMSELDRYLKRYGIDFLNGKVEWASKTLRDCPDSKRRILCLYDMSLKNVFCTDDTFIHFDLENTVIGPPEFFIVKTAVNLARDEGTAGLDAGAWLLARCESSEIVTSSLTFIIVRMLLFNRIAMTRFLEPHAALIALERHGSALVALREIAHARDEFDRRRDTTN